ncbi:MAG TPA: hypothetical protein VIL72_09840 [Beijerinckiaceae bacterium]|jgi:hypothetical protein
MIRRSSNLRRSVLAGVACALIAGSAAPALALDDGDENVFMSLGHLIGLGSLGFGFGGSDEGQPRIEYRERAPLVLPPNLSHLPPPAAGPGQRNGAWPEDYDAMRARQARERAARATQYDARVSAEELARGRRVSNVARNPAAEQCPDGVDASGRVCDPESFWNTLKNTRSAESSAKDLVAGQEPDRRALTDPPRGMRTPTKNVKYTFEVDRDVDIRDPRAQMREDARREEARRMGRE